MKACLDAGVNDLGGTLMNESISRAAGASHGQEFTVADMRDLITAAGRVPQQRTTRYEAVTEADPELFRGSAASSLVPGLQQVAQ